ncbi:MAG: hypothetical protein JWN98_742, partial [Abditibacteriota bacterium]|nr:hypothetical protein [Abditibacteriota bacterium]
RLRETELRRLEFQHALGSMHANDAYAAQSISFRKPTNISETLQVGMYAQLDPRLQIAAKAHSADIESVVDEMGRSLLLPTHKHLDAPIMESYGIRMGTLDISLRLKPTTGTRIARLKGSYRLRIATKSESWEITDLLKAPQSKRITRLGTEQSLTFLSMQREGREWHVNVLVQNEGPLRLRLPGGALGVGTLRLLDAQNRVFWERGSAFGGDSNSARGPFMFSTMDHNHAESEPTKLIWTFPVEWKEVDLPFEFENLPLP